MIMIVCLSGCGRISEEENAASVSLTEESSVLEGDNAASVSLTEENSSASGEGNTSSASYTEESETLSDGEYAATVSLTGGSGRAYIESPCTVTVENGSVKADIIWSSDKYDYMIVDGVQYNPVNTEGNSEFIIPIELEKEMAVQADTTAMSKPHLIDYTLKFSVEDSAHLAENANSSQAAAGRAGSSQTLAGNDSASKAAQEGYEDMSAPQIKGLKYISTDKNEYATGYSIHRYDKGFSVICVRDGRKYLLIPEGESAPDEPGDGIYAIKLPLSNIYLAASAAMSQFEAIGAMDTISFVATDKDDWYVESAVKAMENGDIIYGGKYRAPDYETLLSGDADIAIENTMILRNPDVIEKLSELGIQSFIDWSSYEPEVFGRLEWIKVYGLLTGREDEAKEEFLAQKKMADSVDASNFSGKSVVVFSMNSNHQIVVKEENDYLVKMIEAAGGKYLLQPGKNSGQAISTNISIEAFYSYATDADVLIYNGVIETAPESLDELRNMDTTFKDFKAIQNGDVWCIDKSLYQFTSKTGTIIENLYEVLSFGKEDTDFLYKLK